MKKVKHINNSWFFYVLEEPHSLKNFQFSFYYLHDYLKWWDCWVVGWCNDRRVWRLPGSPYTDLQDQPARSTERGAAAGNSYKTAPSAENTSVAHIIHLPVCPKAYSAICMFATENFPTHAHFYLSELLLVTSQERSGSTFSNSHPSSGVFPLLKISHTVAPKLHLSQPKVRFSGLSSSSGATQGILSRVTKHQRTHGHS